MEILFLENNVIERLGNRLVPNNNIEVRLLEKYKLERHDIDMHGMAAKELIEHYYGVGADYEFSKVETFFRIDNFITTVSRFIETVDILLLNKVEDVDFENIVFHKKDDVGFYFEVKPRIIGEVDG